MSKIETHDALLEIGVETLPARFVARALGDLKAALEAGLSERGLKAQSVSVYGSPMRLAALMRGLPCKSETQSVEVSGPPAKLLKDASGHYTKQADGFARKQGVSVEELKTVILPKGEFLMAVKVVKGVAASDLLADVFVSAIGALQFPKSMVWEESGFRFARPIRTLVGLYGKKVVKFSIAGVHSGNKTRGLAATGAKPVAIPEPSKYVDVLRDQCVIVDPEERREKLLKSLRQASKKASGNLDEDPDLLEQTLWLTEHPTAVLGRFDKDFLNLPRRLLLMVLKKQLMFFPVLDSNGDLTEDFLGVRDGMSEGQKQIQIGYERVLSARLNDARFFIGRDRKITLESRLEKLARVGFQKGLGSMGDKTKRLIALSDWACSQILQHRPVDGPSVSATAKLAYADLVSDVIGEFPELQGVMGGVYARFEGQDERVALGLEEFYYPVAANAPLPSMLEGCLVSFAGKLDTITAMFSAGFIPSGSEDPFGLRRLGNGVVRILLEKQIPISISDAVAKAVDVVAAVPGGRAFDRSKTRSDVEEFLWQRLESLLLEKGFKGDEIRSVKDGGLTRLPETFRRISAVHQLRSETDFLELAQAFKRASNILKKNGDGGAADVHKELFKESAERELYGALCRVEGDVREKVSQGMYEDGLRALVGLKPQVDKFFEDVMVMAKEEEVKVNRLSLLARLVRLFKSVADISHIQN